MNKLKPSSNSEYVKCVCYNVLCRDVLKDKGHLDTSKKIIPTSRDHYAIAITSDAKEVFTSGRVPEGCVLSTAVLPLATTRQQPLQMLKDVITNLLPQQSVKQLPHHWIKHGDLIVLPSNSFSDVQWDSVNSAELWRGVAEALGAKRLAIEDHVCDDNYRTPTCRLLLGDNGLVEHVDNKVRYIFNITKSMFCHGNITEKIRMSKLSCNNEVILDLFAGIGYFTLPLLVHTSAKRVHSCDWSGDAIDALHKGLAANHVTDRCIVHHGDCRKVRWGDSPRYCLLCYWDHMIHLAHMMHARVIIDRVGRYLGVGQLWLI